MSARGHQPKKPAQFCQKEQKGNSLTTKIHSGTFLMVLSALLEVKSNPESFR